MVIETERAVAASDAKMGTSCASVAGSLPRSPCARPQRSRSFAQPHPPAPVHPAAPACACAPPPPPTLPLPLPPAAIHQPAAGPRHRRRTTSLKGQSEGQGVAAARAGRAP
eukprot:6001825-Prymnesium_polylepis.2